MSASPHCIAALASDDGRRESLRVAGVAAGGADEVAALAVALRAVSKPLRDERVWLAARVENADALPLEARWLLLGCLPAGEVEMRALERRRRCGSRVAAQMELAWAVNTMASASPYWVSLGAPAAASARRMPTVHRRARRCNGTPLKGVAC